MKLELKHQFKNELLDFNGVLISIQKNSEVACLIKYLKENKNNPDLVNLIIQCQEKQIDQNQFEQIWNEIDQLRVQFKQLILHFGGNKITCIDRLSKSLEFSTYQDLEVLLLGFGKNKIYNIDSISKALEKPIFQILEKITLDFQGNNISSVESLGKSFYNQPFQYLQKLSLNFKGNQNGVGFSFEENNFQTKILGIENGGKKLTLHEKPEGFKPYVQPIKDKKQPPVNNKDQQIQELQQIIDIQSFEIQQLKQLVKEKDKRIQNIQEEKNQEKARYNDQTDQVQHFKEIVQILEDINKNLEQENKKLQKMQPPKKQENKQENIKEQDTIKKIEKPMIKCQQQQNKKHEFIAAKTEMFQQYYVKYKSFYEFKKKYELLGKVLGNGTYGYVQELKVKDPQKQNQDYQDNQQQLAVKILKCNDGINFKESQEKELIALQHLQILPEKLRKYVIEMKEAYYDINEQKIYMVIPKCQSSFNDDIQQRINQQNFYDPDDLCYKLSCVLLGLQAIESVGLIHRDIKPHNMLIMQDGSLILADYGTAKKLDNLMTIQIGTPSFFSPELVMTCGSHQNKEYNQSLRSVQEYKANDLYAIGQTFVLAASLEKAPVAENSSTWFYNYNQKRQVWLEFAIQKIRDNGKYSENFINLLVKMVEQNPEKRYSLQKCLEEVEGLPDWNYKDYK